MRALPALLLFTTIAFAQSVSRLPASGVSARGAAEIALLPTDERIHIYQTVLAKSPDDHTAQAGLTSAYLQKLRETADYHYLDLAAKLVDRMLEDNGGSLGALRFQNEIDLQRHDFRAVADRAESVLKYDRSDPGIWGNLGDALMELGEYERGGDAYVKMFSLRPNLGSYNRLAYFRFITGDASSALALMKEAIAAGDAQTETVAWCWAELGDMQFKTGQLEDARKSYGSALVLFPKLHRALAGLARVQSAQKDLDGAIKNYLRAQAIVPLVEYASDLANLYEASGQPANARKQRDLIETIEKLGQATNEKTNRNLALALANQGMHLNTALKLMETELPTRPDVYTYDALAWTLYKNGRVAEAADAMKKAVRLNTPEPLLYLHAKEIAFAVGDKKSAQAYGLRLQALNARFDVAQIKLGQ